jgi:hypothetical protein
MTGPLSFERTKGLTEGHVTRRGALSIQQVGPAGVARVYSGRMDEETSISLTIGTKRRKRMERPRFSRSVLD